MTNPSTKSNFSRPIMRGLPRAPELVRLLLAAPWARVPPPRACDFAAVNWDQYHASNDREWLLPYEGPLAAHLRSKALHALPRDAPLLELGCGTSDLAARLFDDGWRNVTAIDLSPNAVRLAQQRHGTSRPGLRFAVGDARELRAIPDASIACVIDKGTLDAICVGDGFDYEARRVAAEAVRVLAPGGRLMCLSLMPPSVLLPLLQRHEWSMIKSEPVGGLHLYYAMRSRKGAMMTQWHWHPIEGGWLTRIKCAV